MDTCVAIAVARPFRCSTSWNVKWEAQAAHGGPGQTRERDAVDTQQRQDRARDASNLSAAQDGVKGRSDFLTFRSVRADAGATARRLEAQRCSVSKDGGAHLCKQIARLLPGKPSPIRPNGLFNRGTRFFGCQTVLDVSM